MIHISKITDAMGNVTTFNYDANDNIKVARQFGQLNDVPGTNGNIRLAESRYEYDGLDRPIRTHDLFFSLPSQAPIGDGERTTTFAYAPASQCTSITDDLGRVTRFGYDTAGRSASVTNARHDVIVIARDACGSINSRTSIELSDLGGPPQVFSWTSIFDERNRCVSTADNVGNTNLFAYDARDNCVRVTDPKGNETIYAYDGLSRGLSFTASQGAAVSGIVVSSGQFEYDDNDRCISSTDANGNVTLYAYDSLDRLTQTVQADGTHNALVWSPHSNLIQETDANGTVITYAYDANDRCVSNHITPGAGVAATTTFETFAYDGCSRLVAATNDASRSEIEYDSLGDDWGNHTDGWNVLSTYDSVGRRTSLTYPGGRVLIYAYDVLDQCTNIMESGVSLASFAYDGPGRAARVAYGNGMRTRIFYDGVSGTPNAPGDFGSGQVSRVLHAMNGGSPQVSEIKLAWDRNGNKISRDDAIFQPAIPRTNSMLLDYDAVDRLAESAVLRGSTLLRDTIYGLDHEGNRTNVTGAASCPGSYFMDAIFPGPLDFQMNQYTATPCDTRTYDDTGNLVSRSSPVTGPVTYQYDYADRLVQVQAIDLSSGTAVITTSTYAYDALGRRISKTVSSGGLPPVTTDFLYDGDAVIEERSGGATTATYGRAFYIGSNEVFNKRSFGQDYFFHTDDQGNVLALTGANGAVVERYDYDDYGAATFLSSDGIPTSATSSAVGNPYCWHGLRLDAETGLHNDDGGDYFDPQSGRYTVRGYTATARSDTRLSADCINPWSGGAPVAMKKGTVKFFNQAKGFGIIAGGSGAGGQTDLMILRYLLGLRGSALTCGAVCLGGNRVWPSAGCKIIVGNTVGASAVVISSR